MRLLVAGSLAGAPGQGGASWAMLQYVLGLERLGHDVVFVEPVADLARRPDIASYFARIQAAFGLRSAALLDEASGATVGLTYRRLLTAARGADLLLNVSGRLADEALLDAVKMRAYVDLDPGFTQLWALQGVDMGFDRHDRFVTIGRGVPECGRDWVWTPQPVVMERWPVAQRLDRPAATSVANWRSYGSIHHRGVFYGQKAHALRELIDLPAQTSARVALALDIHPDESADLVALDRHGWTLLDPRSVAGTPWDYQRFVQGSWAELGVAKAGYVASRCGWFSDRSACYLASGRPVVAQDTGFGDWLPVGEGVLAFSDTASAAAALETLRSDYERHRRSAREIAAAYLDSDRVLEELLSCL